MSSIPTTSLTNASACNAHVFAEIAVPIHDLSCDTAALEAAAQLARHHGARLDVIQVVALPVPVGDTWALMPNPAFSQMYTKARASASECSAKMRQKLAALEVPGEVRPMEALYVDPANLAAIAARDSDIAIIARPRRAPRDEATVHSYFAALLLDSARPVLVIPDDHPMDTVHHALIAWRETRECARAMKDALPFLKACEHVDLLVVDPRATLVESAEEAGTAAVHYLAGHGIDAHRITAASEGHGIGATILDEARQRHVDLLVAGGYGHSRVREWAIGGTTRHLFFETPIPVLFSH